MMPTRLAIIGDGKMGRSVRELAVDAGFEVVAFLGESDVAGAGLSAAHVQAAEVAIEFTVPTAAESNVRTCAAAGVPVVCGTTGWDDAFEAVARDVTASGGALLWSPNFSLGVHLFARVVERAAAEVAAMPGVFDAHFVETHHAGKKDAPSGTARLLQARARPALGAIPVTSIRTGHVPGTHELVLDGPFEQVTLRHEARDRRVFAAGALAAARWLVGRKGVFTMDDMFGGSK